VIFYEEPEISGSVLLLPGDFAVIPPEEAHKPRCMAGKSMSVKKIVVKVSI
jgi:YhcH/YjgK/YiaL family protein